MLLVYLRRKTLESVRWWQNRTAWSSHAHQLLWPVAEDSQELNGFLTTCESVLDLSVSCCYYLISWLSLSAVPTSREKETVTLSHHSEDSESHGSRPRSPSLLNRCASNFTVPLRAPSPKEEVGWKVQQTTIHFTADLQSTNINTNKTKRRWWWNSAGSQIRLPSNI